MTFSKTTVNNIFEETYSTLQSKCQLLQNIPNENKKL